MISAILAASRPLSWVNTAYPFAAAYFLSTGRIDATLIVGTLFFLVPYNLAMYGINDVFDYESDLRNPRKGGIEGAVLAPSLHKPILWVAASSTIPFLVWLVIAGSPASWVVLAVSVAAVVGYSAPGIRLKERPFVDSITSSIHFVSPAVYGLVLAGASFTPQLLAVLGAFLLWGIGSHAFGAVQDVPADREGGIRSIATTIGSKHTVRFAVAAYLAAAVCALFSAWPGQLAAVLAIPYALNILPWWSVADGDAESANRGWKRFLGLNFVTGFLVTLVLIGYGLLRFA